MSIIAVAGELAPAFIVVLECDREGLSEGVGRAGERTQPQIAVSGPVLGEERSDLAGRHRLQLEACEARTWRTISAATS